MAVVMEVVEGLDADAVGPCEMQRPGGAVQLISGLAGTSPGKDAKIKKRKNGRLVWLFVYLNVTLRESQA